MSVKLRTYESKRGKALRSMGDLCAIVKLSEVFSDCYVEQYDAYRKISNSIALI